MGRESGEAVGVRYWDMMGGIPIDGFVAVEWDRSYALTNGEVCAGPERDFLLIAVIDHSGRPAGWLAITNEEVTSMEELPESDPLVSYYQAFDHESSPVKGEPTSLADLLECLESIGSVVTVYTKSSGTMMPITGSVEAGGDTWFVRDTRETVIEPTPVEVADVQAVEWGHPGALTEDHSWEDEVVLQRIVWDRGHDEFDGVSILPVDSDGFSAWCKVDSRGRYDGLVWLLDHEISSKADTALELGGFAPPWSGEILGYSSVRALLTNAADDDLLVSIFFVRTGAQELLVGKIHSIVGDRVRFETVTPGGHLDDGYSVVEMENVLAVEVDSQYLQMLDHARATANGRSAE